MSVVRCETEWSRCTYKSLTGRFWRRLGNSHWREGRHEPSCDWRGRIGWAVDALSFGRVARIGKSRCKPPTWHRKRGQWEESVRADERAKVESRIVAWLAQQGNPGGLAEELAWCISRGEHRGMPPAESDAWLAAPLTKDEQDAVDAACTDEGTPW